jgi:glycosyltransferase involved in cell wall biosynthesis
MQDCRAFCVPGLEDFGITAIEANAAGKPVVALAAGGSLETLEETVTASFFSNHEPEQLLNAIHRCDQMDIEPATIAEHAQRFSSTVFRQRMADALWAGLQRRPDRRART